MFTPKRAIEVVKKEYYAERVIKLARLLGVSL